MTSLARVAAPAALLGGLLAPADAFAQLLESGPYVGVSAGVLLLNENEGGIGPVDTSIDFDSGYDLAVQLGYRFSLFRVELEAEYGEAPVDRARVGAVSVDPDVDLAFARGTLGAYVDLTIVPLVTPYAGGGAGVAYVHGDSTVIDGVTLEIESDTHLTAHGEVGVALDFIPFITIAPAYRFIWIDNGDDTIEDTTAHVVKLGARLEF